MALEPITRQEQIIAGKNLEPITRMERFLKEYGGGTGGSVQSDWNQTDSSAADFIKNKPFGDMPTGGDTLYWDGNTEGLVSVDATEIMGLMLYRTSDAIVTIDDLSDNAYFKANNIDGNFTFGLTEKDEIAPGFAYADFSGSFVFFVAQEGVGIVFNGLSFQEPGIYQAGGDAIFYTSLTIPGYTGFPVTKKMEEKYLPGAVILYSDGTYLYNTEDVTDAAKRTTKAEFEKLLFSIQKICVGVDDGGMIYFTPDMYYEQENYMVASSSTAQLGFYTAEYTAS